MKSKEYFPIYENTEQKMNMQLNILSDRPQKGVAKKHEYLMWDIINKAFNMGENFIPGDEKAGEPDFVNQEKTIGFEMTFISSRNEDPIIYRMKKGSLNFTDKDALKWMIESIDVKAVKKENETYSVASISLVTMIPIPIESWTLPFVILDSCKLTKVFHSLNQKYIQENIFKEIYIIIPTPNQKMTIYSISLYEDSERFYHPQEIEWDDDRINIV